MSMYLSEEEREVVAMVTGSWLAKHRMGGGRTWKSVQALHLRSLRASEVGTGDGEDLTQSNCGDVELIGVVEAAEILGCSGRWVRRIASDLDGLKVGRGWIFPRQNVIEYAKAKGTLIDSH